MILSYLSSNFYSYNIEILLQRTESLSDIKFHQNRSEDSAYGLPVLDCPAEVMHIDF